MCGHSHNVYKINSLLPFPLFCLFKKKSCRRAPAWHLPSSSGLPAWEILRLKEIKHIFVLRKVTRPYFCLTILQHRWKHNHHRERVSSTCPQSHAKHPRCTLWFNTEFNCDLILWSSDSFLGLLGAFCSRYPGQNAFFGNGGWPDLQKRT